MTVEERLAEDIKVETKTDIARHGLIVYGHIENRHRQTWMHPTHQTYQKQKKSETDT